ncbi:Hypothetical predicted protein [Octopus vulgaris]|uniref:Uncharacterized protein n=1 Tax=Octopus vulgaris TaxID=6645 RepID=A0AA36BCL9_OCTVU|nr:Hypothetical predicted protein [Octopus vulgaris]
MFRCLGSIKARERQKKMMEREMFQKEKGEKNGSVRVYSSHSLFHHKFFSVYLVLIHYARGFRFECKYQSLMLFEVRSGSCKSILHQLSSIRLRKKPTVLEHVQHLLTSKEISEKLQFSPPSKSLINLPDIPTAS